MTDELYFKVSKDERDILSVNYSVLQIKGRPHHFFIVLPNVTQKVNYVRLFIE